MELKDLNEKPGYVLFTYPDSSVLCIHTTMNDQMLRDVYKYKRENSLFDLDKRRWIDIPENAKMSLHENKPIGGKDEFINRFL